MQEESVTLRVGDEQFSGRLSTPEEETERGILVIPGAGHGPFGDVFDEFAEAATEAGHELARFETWTSSDELEEKTAAQFRSEIEAGVDFLRGRGCSTVTVVAKSFGGRLALEHAPELADRMVLWAPAIVFGDHDDDVPSITAGELSEIEIPVRVLQGDEDEVVPLDNAGRIAEHLHSGELVELPGEDHSFQNDRARIVEKTVEFLPE